MTLRYSSTAASRVRNLVFRISSLALKNMERCMVAGLDCRGMIHVFQLLSPSAVDIFGGPSTEFGKLFLDPKQPGLVLFWYEYMGYPMSALLHHSKIAFQYIHDTPLSNVLSSLNLGNSDLRTFFHHLPQNSNVLWVDSCFWLLFS